MRYDARTRAPNVTVNSGFRANARVLESIHKYKLDLDSTPRKPRGERLCPANRILPFHREGGTAFLLAGGGKIFRRTSGPRRDAKKTILGGAI